ncbi:MAG: hypothetical protein WCV88_00095 [Patescibacteria group bacterium]
MPIKPRSIQINQTKRLRNWPSLMATVAYCCAGLSIILVFAQFALYSNQYNQLFNSDVVSAVTLTNGQTYFGHIKKYGPGSLVLFDVYYLQVSPKTDTTNTATDTNTDTTTPDNGVKLKKLADDFYKPNNYIIINRNEILFWQHLTDSSPIIDAINKYQAEN